MQLEIKIDEEVFKLEDPKVDRLRSGRLSVEAFSLLVSPQDPYVLVGDTIYALSEAEYYALRLTLPVNRMNAGVFEYVLGLDSLDFMSEADRLFVEDIRRSLPGCPECRRRHYMDTVYQLIRKYSIPVPSELMEIRDEEKGRLPDYPRTREPVATKVTHLLDGMLSGSPITRKPCLDCVEKHLAQAYVLGREALLGYPEHLLLMSGHLGEAVDETPQSMSDLKDTLLFCLARTSYTRRPFLPLNLIMPMLELARTRMDRSGAVTDADVAGMETNHLPEFALDWTRDLERELTDLDPSLKSRAVSLISDIRMIDLSPGPEYETHRMQWTGSMGQLSDLLSDSAPLTASVLRNRRLLFTARPELAAESGMGAGDVGDFLSADLDHLD